jgi:hypothetical protein
MSPRWLYWPAITATEVVGTTTGWVESVTNPIRSAVGWSAGPFGSGSTSMDLNNVHGAFIIFNTGANASAFITANGSKNVKIDHVSGQYTWNNSSGGGMSIFATVYVKLALTGWSGTIPGATDVATITVES